MNPLVKCAALLGLTVAGSLLGFNATAARAAAATTSAAKPNIVIFLADDMGYSDLGCYGGEIQTPNLDRLAQNGLRFTQFYNTARCWPTRAALLTGYYAQEVRRDIFTQHGSGAKGTRPSWAGLVSLMLESRGYHSYHSGKWHVDGKPLENGFERSYWLEDTNRHFGPQTHYENDQPLPPVDPASGYFSSTAIADHAIKYLQEHAQQHTREPFFAYVAFISPHFPLQAPAVDVARYKGRYSSGWETIRQARWQRLQKLGIAEAALSEVERDVGPPYPFPADIAKLGPNEIDRPVPWASLNAAQKQFQADKMAIHAAMIDRMDQEIGRVVEQIRAMGALANTLILFLSDNGASAEMMVRGDGHDPEAAPGSAATFLCLGPGWSTVANTPFRRHKTWVHEGGISTPLIAHWPNGIAARGELRHAPGHVIDVVPTLLDLAGDARASSNAAQISPPFPGRSFVSLFKNDDSPGERSFWFLHERNRALRLGDWKIVAAAADTEWSLYDLASDRAESHNLAAAKPAKVRELADEWTRQAELYRQWSERDRPTSAAK